MNKISNLYIISILNTKFIQNYIKNFLNSSVNISLTLRLLPIIIPTLNQISQTKIIFNNCINIQKQKFNNEITENKAKELLDIEQGKLDKIVNEIYKIN